MITTLLFLAAATCTAPTNCYATCHQFESALLVGCYLSDFEGRKESDKIKRKKNFDRHEEYCRKLVKELMGKEWGCK